jgi:zinc protease
MMTNPLHTLSLGGLMLYCLNVQAAVPPVHEFMLDNGLKLVVQEDHRAPVAVSQVWYKIGSSYEYDGITGVSHALEHMMFKGTQKHGPGEFSRIIAENGGQENAFTSDDYTAYFQTLERSRLPVSFELEADRMRNLNLLEQEFAKEIKVVMEERRLRTEDKPQAFAYETAQATAYQTSPYRHPVIGWMRDLEAMTVEDLRAWYRRWYAPNNAIVVVVGDVDPKAVYALAKTYFGPLPAEPAGNDKPRSEVPQQGIKRVTVRRVAELPYLILAYKVPVLKTAIDQPDHVPAWDVYALEVLAGLLGGGESARLNKNLVRGREIAASVGAGYSLISRLDSLFVFDGVPAHGHTVEELKAGLREELKRVQNRMVDPKELQRVKTQVITNTIYQQDSMFYQAMQIGSLESIGLSWRLKDTYVDRIKAVTAEQVQAVARNYLVDDHLTVAVLDPVPAKGSNDHQPATKVIDR